MGRKPWTAPRQRAHAKAVTPGNRPSRIRELHSDFINRVTQTSPESSSSLYRPGTRSFIFQVKLTPSSLGGKMHTVTEAESTPEMANSPDRVPEKQPEPKVAKRGPQKGQIRTYKVLQGPTAHSRQSKNTDIQKSFLLSSCCFVPPCPRLAKVPCIPLRCRLSAGVLIPGASVAICTSQPSLQVTPCGSSSKATIYTDLTLSTAISPNPLTTDASGMFYVYDTPGTVSLLVSDLRGWNC